MLVHEHVQQTKVVLCTRGFARTCAPRYGRAVQRTQQRSAVPADPHLKVLHQDGADDFEEQLDDIAQHVQVDAGGLVTDRPQHVPRIRRPPPEK